MSLNIKALLVFFIFCLNSYSNDSIVIVNDFYNIDSVHNLILINEDIRALNNRFSSDIKTVTLNEPYSFEHTISEFQLGRKYNVKSKANEVFVLYFTQLPIISISCKGNIADEPRILAQFKMIENNGNSTSSNIGIEYRGATAQSYPKKSYRIEFWSDTIGDDTQDIELLEMRKDDDWNLQAMYNEPLRVRSKSNFELWQIIDTLHYLADEPKAINGVRQKYVEIFLNDKYNGVYALSERVDRKQLKLEKFKANEINGELYKGVGWGASTYKNVPYVNKRSDLWGGFELKYPDDTISWSYIHDFVNFVVNSDSSQFYSHYQNLFNIDNAINYFIFLNLIRAIDNTGKNIFVAKYQQGMPYFYVPWDLDGTLGISWNGTQDNTTNTMLSNGFYDRLSADDTPDGFVDQLQKRWNKLKESTITPEYILYLLTENYTYLKYNGVYERETQRWQECDYLDSTNLAYTSTWLRSRISYLDSFITTQEIITDLKDNSSHEITITIFPNPTESHMTIVSEVLFKIDIIDLAGNVLTSTRMRNSSTQLNTENLPKGIYTMRLSNSNRVIVKKFIKK